MQYNISLICYSIRMANFSFDAVSDYDKAELNNVFDQVKREIDSRYDFKNTPAAIEWLDGEKSGFKLIGSSDMQIDSLVEILRKKLAARNQSQKLLDVSQDLIETNLKTTQVVPFVHGLSQDKAKSITQIIRTNFPKVKSQIQGDAVRINSTSKDELQAVMNLLRVQDFDFPLSFDNFR
jgi:uncharacterized protein YajQ (UPF0234 family)